jgi:hypothetical protein
MVERRQRPHSQKDWQGPSGWDVTEETKTRETEEAEFVRFGD